MPSFDCDSRLLFAGKYQSLADINKGSYGVVSLVKDVTDGTHYALKCIAKSRAPQLDEARHEIEMHKRLGEHRNIARLIDHFEENDNTYLVLEYCPAGDLYEAIKAGRGPRDQGTVLEFMSQLIDAVIYCHSVGVYHRDIKPENILITADGTVKLADWGLATTVRVNREFGVGSERYMAPELFDEVNTTEYDAAMADIWSVGICLLNILFGRNPFTVASQKDKLFLDFASSREALFDIFPTLSPDVFSVLRHALTLDPDNRCLENIRSELHNIQLWTTDDEYYDDDDVVEEYDDVVVEDPTIVDQVVPTTADRQPFRTPSRYDDMPARGLDYEWIRTMQFTPPSHSMSHITAFGKTHHHVGPSNLSVVFSADEDGDTSTPVSDDERDDVFAMDLTSSLEKMVITERTGSGSDGSLSSAPSLVQSMESKTEYNGSESGLAIPSSCSLAVSSASGTKDFFKIGKSWSDIDFDDDDDNVEDDQFYEMIRASLPSSASRLSSKGYGATTSNGPAIAGSQRWPVSAGSNEGYF
jgi:serine/threonine protein kinase